MVIGAASSTSVATLRGLARFLTNTLENVSSFSDANILDLVNIHYREIQSFLLSNLLNDWKENTTDGTGSGLINLVAGTSSYSLATDLMSIDKIEINYSNSTNGYEIANIIKLGSLKEDEAISNTSNYIDRFGETNVLIRSNKIVLGKVPSISVTSGIKVYYTSLITDLVEGTGSTSTPVFNASFHHILSKMASADWLASKDQQTKSQLLMKEVEVLKDALLNFYSNRDADDSIRISPVYTNFK